MQPAKPPNTALSRASLLGRGYAAALISAAVLSTTAIFIRYLTQTYALPALVLAFWREVFVALSLLPVLAWLRRPALRAGKRHLPFLIVFGFLLALFNGMWTISVAWNGAALATVLAYTSPAFTAFLGRWLLRERLDWAKWLAVAICVAGCVLVSEALDARQQINLPGILSGVLAGLLYAGYSLMGRAAAQRGLNPWTTLLYTFAVAAVFMLSFNLLFGAWLPEAATRPAELFWLGDAWAGWGVLLILAAVPTLLGFGAYNIALGYLPGSVVNLIATLEPAFTAVIAFLLLGERLSAVQIGGSVLILAGVIFLRLYEGWLEARARLLPEAQAEIL